MDTEAMRLWFEKLEPRERWLVALAGVVTLLALAYGLVVQPLSAARARAELQLTEQRQLLLDVEQVARRLGPQSSNGSSGPVPATGESLVVLVDRSTRERGLGSYLKRNQPEGNDGVRLRLENAPFDTLAEWLGELQSRYGLATTSASFDPSGEPGRVNSSLVLAGAGR